MHIAARAEIAAGPRDHHAPDRVGVDEVSKGVAQFAVSFERERVLAFRPVERDGRDLAVELPEEMLRLKFCKIDPRRPKPADCFVMCHSISFARP